MGLCPVCWWEDDGQEDADACDVRLTVNGQLSLIEAREHYAQCGAGELFLILGSSGYYEVSMSQGSAANLVKLTVFLTDMQNLGLYREARNRFFASVAPPAAPAVTLVEVSKLYGADFMIEIEAIAAV